MKKLLALILVLGFASLASAGLQISVNGIQEPLESEIVLMPSETVILDIWTDADIAGDAGYYAMIVGIGNGSITGGDVVVDPANQGVSVYDDAVNVGGIPVPEGTNGVWGGVTVFPGEPVIPAGSTLIDGILFHCEAPDINPGDTLVQLVEVDGFTWTVTGVLDEVVIHQIPEPASLALLGLGGLFLRRRK